MKSNKSHVWRLKRPDPYRFERYKLLATLIGAGLIALIGCVMVNEFLNEVFKYR